MAILFCGGELEDFTTSGTVTHGAAAIRTTYARTSIEINGGAFGTNYARASFAAQTSFWMTARFIAATTSSFATSLPLLWFASGGAARLRLRNTGSAPTTLIVDKWDGTTATTLGTSTATLAITTGYRFDINVSYGAAGFVKVYLDGALIIDTGTVDTRAGGATSLDSVNLAAATNNTAAVCRWQEIIVTDGEDSRPLSLKTLAPNAAGDVAGWTSGGFGDIDEITAADSDLAVSDTALQVLSVNCTGMPTGASGLSVRAVKSVALAARGATGPSKLALGLRQSSTNGFAAGQTLDTGYGAVSTTWTVNPVTSAAFTAAEIDAIQLAYRSEA